MIEFRNRAKLAKKPIVTDKRHFHKLASDVAWGDDYACDVPEARQVLSGSAVIGHGAGTEPMTPNANHLQPQYVKTDGAPLVNKRYAGNHKRIQSANPQSFKNRTNRQQIYSGTGTTTANASLVNDPSLRGGQ